MCGILGIFGSEASNYANTNLSLMSRRGPDSSGILEIDNRLIFAATRLAMTDPLPRSNQPMVDFENGNLLVFNGEIFNYLEIRKLMIDSGVVFKTDSDTEVLLKVLSVESKIRIESLEGMFAFAFYSKRENKIVLARDYLGKKPLYYSAGKDFFIFSSQINLIKGYINRVSIDNQSLLNYLKLGYLVDPNTMYNEIKSVNPGEVLEFDLNSLSFVSRSSFIPTSILKPPSMDFAESIKTSFESRVNGHSNIAISLSGGVDSTALALQSVMSVVDCSAYSMWWPDADKQRYNQDYFAAKAVARSLNLRFIPVEMPSLNQIEDQVSLFVKAMGEPNSNPSGISMMSLYKKISEDGIRVVLTGDGADEIFGGYDRYKIIRKLDKFPSVNLSLLKSLLKDKDNSGFLRKFAATFQSSKTEEFWCYWHELANGKNLKKITHSSDLGKIGVENFPSFRDLYGTDSKIGNMMIRDLKIWLTMESNRKLDRISMWNSIEARSPFQSEKVIGLAYTRMIDTHFKELNKNTIRETFPQLMNLPINKNKLGFISPLGHWLRNNPDLIHDSLRYISVNFGYDSFELQRLAKSPFGGKYTDFRFLWSLIILAKWHDFEK